MRKQSHCKKCILYWGVKVITVNHHLTSDLCVRPDLKDKNFEVVSLDEVGVVGFQLLHLGPLPLHLLTNLQKQQLSTTWHVTGSIRLARLPPDSPPSWWRKVCGFCPAACSQCWTCSCGSWTVWSYQPGSLWPRLPFPPDAPEPRITPVKSDHRLNQSMKASDLQSLSLFLSLGSIILTLQLRHWHANWARALLLHSKRAWGRKLKQLACYNMLLKFSYRKLIVPFQFQHLSWMFFRMCQQS